MYSSGQPGKVLVVGAGVAGIRAALDLAETGYHVLLTESSPAIGGILSKLDYQFPTDHCGMCRMLPFVGREYASQFCMRKGLFHDNIEIMPNTEVISCEGDAGSFEVKLRHRAQLVDTTICIGEGNCAEVCPIEVKDEFNEGLTFRKAIHRPVPHNLPNLFVIDEQVCDKCGECLKVCPVNAIDLEAENTDEVVQVGAVVLAAGAGLFRPDAEPDFYSYGRSDDVLTSLEFERVLSASGTSSGKLVRPHDGKEINKIAWLQCVGSRNRKAGRDYCSAVCCMFALKEAVLARQKGGPDTEVTIFYMDMRTYGKGYYQYRVAAEKDKGVRLVRCRAHSVHHGEDGEAVIRYFGADGRSHEESFDLVVLATGQTPPAEVVQMSRLFGFELNPAGFVATDGEYGVATSAPGVFACGSMTGLKDISETVLQGSAAALESSKLMQAKGLGWEERHATFKERDVAREAPLVDIVICRWPLREGAHGIDFNRLADSLRECDRVANINVIDEICRGGLDKVRELLSQSRANRVILAACLPYVYKKLLKETALLAGFNLALVEVLDLRGHIRRLLHTESAERTERSARDQLLSKVEEICAKDPVRATSVRVEHRAVVIGGGLSGMQAALAIAMHGVEVALVEKSETLGGHALKLHYTLEGIDPRELATRLVDEVRSTHGINVFTNAEIVKSNGSVGRYQTTIRVADREEPLRIDHAVTVVATGGGEAPTDEYCYGQSDSILTQETLELGLVKGSVDPQSLRDVVMIQCVGSREAGKREYCSRLCCSAALKNALKLIELNPNIRIIVLYRDMMAYGFKEKHYSEARAKGVVFSTYRPEDKPQVSVDQGKPTVVFTDEVLGREVKIDPDLLILSTGIVPGDNANLASKLGLDLTENGFFSELDYKWKPVETLKEGVYLCGLAHSPRSIPEALIMAEAAAERALSILSHKELTSARLVSKVRQALCSVCELCVELCPYQARSVDPATGRIAVDELACLGCGICVAGCPSGAASFAGRLETQVMTALDAQLGGIQ